MARKEANQQEVKLWEKAKWKGFVSVAMTEAEKKAIKDSLLVEEDGFEFLMNAATAGYKCSISYSIPEDVYTASLTGQYQRKPNAGITMSVRHVNLIVCLSALKWCHEEAGASGEWSERFSMSSKDDW
jgi:hypothetical protein